MFWHCLLKCILTLGRSCLLIFSPKLNVCFLFPVFKQTDYPLIWDCLFACWDCEEKLGGSWLCEPSLGWEDYVLHVSILCCCHICNHNIFFISILGICWDCWLCEPSIVGFCLHRMYVVVIFLYFFFFILIRIMFCFVWLHLHFLYLYSCICWDREEKPGWCQGVWA